MSQFQDHLPLRRVAIAFDGVPYLWHPERPRLSRVANAVTWAAVVFESRLCAAFRDALPHIDDPALRAECEAFIAQEATHSRVHRAHMKALIRTHPELDALLPALEALAADHLDGLVLEERIAFGAVVEGWLAPVGRYMVAERERLFRGADARVAALFLWHFSEEIEHRSTALKLHRHLRVRPADSVGAAPRGWRGTLLRQRVAVSTLRLVRKGARLIDTHFAHLPGHASGTPALPGGMALVRLASGLASAHLPRHDASAATMPDWAEHYLDAIRRGTGPVEAWTGHVSDAPTPYSRVIA